MAIIDAHAHIVESFKGIGFRGETRYLGNGIERWISGEETRVLPEGFGHDCFSFVDLLRIMDKNDTEKAVLMQGSIYGLQNEYAAEALKKHPDRFAALGSFDPYCISKETTMRRLIEDFHFTGLKFEMSSRGGFMGFHPYFLVDGEEMRCVFEYAQKYALPVSLDIGSFEQKSFQLDRIVKLAKEYDRISFVIEHMFCAANNQTEQVKAALRMIQNRSNIYVTLASLPINCSKAHLSGYQDVLSYYREAVEMIGSNRIMWGSDAPVTLTKNTYAELISIFSNEYPSKITSNVFFNTAKHVYHL